MRGLRGPPKPCSIPGGVRASRARRKLSSALQSVPQKREQGMGSAPRSHSSCRYSRTPPPTSPEHALAWRCATHLSTLRVVGRQSVRLTAWYPDQGDVRQQGEGTVNNRVRRLRCVACEANHSRAPASTALIRKAVGTSCPTAGVAGGPTAYRHSCTAKLRARISRFAEMPRRAWQLDARKAWQESAASI